MLLRRRPHTRSDVHKPSSEPPLKAAGGMCKESTVEIRKNETEIVISLRKKRLAIRTQQDSDSTATDRTAIDRKKQVEEKLSRIVVGVWSHNRDAQLEATILCRNLLSTYSGPPPIAEVIAVGVVPRLVEFLSGNDFPELQFEAAWALTNISSGRSEYTRVIIDEDAVPIFVELLSSPSDDVRDQAMWALGNVAGDSSEYRDLVLGHGALTPLLKLIENAKLSMLRTATWTLSNFCSGKPNPQFETTKAALPALQRLIQSSDEHVLTDACLALSYICDGKGSKNEGELNQAVMKIQAVIEAGVCHRLVELLLHQSPSVVITALRTVGNIVRWDDLQTQVVIDNQALPCLLILITNTHETKSCLRIKKEACWIISNITAGNKDQIQAVIDADIIPALIQLLTTGEFEIKKEAAWAIYNATSGTHDQIKYLVNQGCIKPLCDLLTYKDARTVTISLECLEKILKVGEAEKNFGNTGGINLYASYIDEAGGHAKIENLQTHDNKEINEKAVNILETYRLEDDEDYTLFL